MAGARPLDEPKGTRFVTFNVCGIKNVLNFHPWNEAKTFAGMFSYMNADIMCFQETKIQSKDLTKDMLIVPGFKSYFTIPPAKKGYSGVALYVKDSIPVYGAEEGLTGWLSDLASRVPYRHGPCPIGHHPEISETDGVAMDSEARSVLLDLGSCVVIGVYCPANSMGHQSDFRELFFTLLDQRIRALRDEGREVVVLGDINVAREPRDSAVGFQELMRSGKVPGHGSMLDPVVVEVWKDANLPRRLVNSWLEDPAVGFEDTTRKCHPERLNMFTCWNQLLNCRPANFGTRIDYIFSSPGIGVTDADILPQYMGSDHCPVFADLRLPNYTAEGTPKVPSLSRKRTSHFEQGIMAMIGRKTKPDTDTPGNDTETPGNDTDTPGNDISRTAPIEIASAPRKVSNQTPSQLKPKSAKKQHSNGQKRITSFFKDSTKDSTKVPHEESMETAIAVQTSLLPKQSGIQKTPYVNTERTEKAWKDIFQLKKPLCYHSEECQLLLSKRPGMNKGRSFWSCKRPHGAEGNPDSRCKFFKWA